jgi:hypothetical protein
LIDLKNLSVHTILGGLEGANNIDALLYDKNDHRAENKDMLKMLAENGFAIVEGNSAQVAANDACLVKANQLVGGPLANQLQDSDLKDALLPSSEALRHMILLALSARTTEWGWQPRPSKVEQSSSSSDFTSPVQLWGSFRRSRKGAPPQLLIQWQLSLHVQNKMRSHKIRRKRMPSSTN